nr:MAG TPA: hypothetical protein [Caudoviricetes sp.]
MPRTVVIGHNSFLLSTYEYRLLQHSRCCSSLVGFKYTLSVLQYNDIALYDSKLNRISLYSIPS